MKRITLALLTLCALAAYRPALAQEMPKPAPEMKKLEVFVGDWLGKMTMTEPGGAEMKADTTLKCDWFAGGMYLRSVYVLELPGMGRMEGTVLMGWDAGSKTYRSWTFENTAPTPREEFGTFAVDKLVMLSKPQSPMITRSTFDIKSPTEIVFTVEMKQGNKWVKAGEARYTKKG